MTNSSPLWDGVIQKPSKERCGTWFYFRLSAVYNVSSRIVNNRIQMNADNIQLNILLNCDLENIFRRDSSNGLCLNGEKTKANTIDRTLCRTTLSIVA